MGFSSFISKIEDGFKSVMHSVLSVASSGYQDAKGAVSGITGSISGGLGKAEDTLSHIVDDGKDLAGKVLDKGGEIISNTENKLSSMVSTPLMLIAGALGLFVVLNGKGLTDIGSKAVDKI